MTLRVVSSLFAVSVASTLGPLPVKQQTCGKALQLVTRPAQPRQGSLFVVRVKGANSAFTFTGRAGGEALHFSRDTGGAFVSLAPAPIDSSALTITVACARGSALDTLRRTVSLASGDYPVEHLRVAARFTTPPDSALLARQRREAERAARVSVIAHDTPRLWSRPFISPRPTRITSRFGKGREFNGTVTSRHMGTDYAGAVGAPIRAANRGIVRLVDEFYLGGKVVYVDHGAGLVTAYLHMSAQRVAPGDTVERGALLGLVGATGRVTGPHLHFIARYGAVSVNPQSLLAVVSGMGYVPIP